MFHTVSGFSAGQADFIIINKYFGGLLITIKLEKILTFHMNQANRT